MPSKLLPTFAGLYPPYEAFMAIFVSLSFIGWGYLVHRLCLVRRALDIGLLAGWGLAATTIIGGVLNLLGVISPLTGRIYLGVGLALLAWLSFGRRRAIIGLVRKAPAGAWRNPVMAAGIAALAVVIIWMISAACLAAYNIHDDAHAYLVFPNKMLEAGSQGHDPFSERRMCEYGGQSFLHALMLTTVGQRGLHAMDMGVGWLLAMALIIGHARRKRVERGVLLGLLLAFVLFGTPGIANVTSLLTGVVLFYSLIRTFLEGRDESLATRVALLGLTLAGICTLKNSFIPPAGLIAAALYALPAATAPLPRQFGEAVLVAVAALVFLAPWMIDMYQSSGTLLYPILGKGTCANAGDGFVGVTCGSFSLANTLSRLTELVLYVPFLACLCLALLPLRRTDLRVADRMTNLIILCAVWAGAFFVGLASDFGIGTRYDFPFTMALTLFLIVDSLEPCCRMSIPAHRCRATACYAAIATVAALSAVGWQKHKENNYNPFGYAWTWSRMQMGETFSNLLEDFPQIWHGSGKLPEALDADRDSPEERLRAVQEATPLEARVLARLSAPYYLNFERNEVWIIDWPGACSPSKPIPLGSAEELAAYLRAQGIRCVMYSYRDEANYSEGNYTNRLGERTGYLGRVRTLSLFTFAFQGRLKELGTMYKKLADDGETFVVDLNAPLNPPKALARASGS